MIMKVFALLAFLVALCAADDDHAESAINLKDIIKKPPSNQLGNDGGKNLKCWECTTTNTTMEPDESLCPDDFSNATQLNPCSSGPSFCVKHEAKGKKYLFFVCVSVCAKILSCTAGRSSYFCGFDFEDLEEKIGDHFSGKLKMNECFDTLQNVTSFRKVCFCDSDGCNSYSYQEDQKDTNGSSLKKVSLVLFSLVAMRFAF